MSLNVPTLLILNTMQCQDILHFRNPSSCSLTSVNCSHFSYCTTTTLLMSCPPLFWTSCHLLLLRREQDALSSSEVGDMTPLGLDGDGPSATCCRRSSFEDLRGQLIFLLQAMGPTKIKVHTLHLRESFKFWINWVSSSMSNLTIQPNIILDGVIRDFCISLR
jgi:hypothetical protein